MLAAPDPQLLLSLRVVSMVGAALQGVLALTLAATLGLTRRGVLPSGASWMYSQLALAMAMLAVIAGMLLDDYLPPVASLWARHACHTLYIAGKLAFVAWIGLGTLEMLGHVPTRVLRRTTALTVAIIAVTAGLASPGVQDSMPLQGLIASIVMGSCAVALFRVDAALRTPASALLAASCGGYVLLSLSYLLNLRYTESTVASDGWMQALLLADRASLPDLLMQFTLGVATVALLFEHQREVAKRAGLQRNALQREAVTTERLETIGRVAATVAHEMNNPLAVVLGTAEHLLLDAPPAAMRDDLQLIMREALRCRHVARELLLFSRGQRPALESCDAAQLVTEAVDSVRLQAAATGVQLVTRVPAAFTLDGESMALQQVLINLLRNAIDVTSRGRVVCASAFVQGPDACFAVDDQGPGISEEMRAHIMEPFFTTKRAGEGTGLGLAIVRGIVSRHGGTLEIGVPPRAAGGTRFLVRIPLFAAVQESTHGGAVDSGAPDGAAHRDAPRLSTPPASLPGIRPEGEWRCSGNALVVDDEVGIRRVLGRLLHRHGLQVELASDGIDAREALQSRDPLAWRVIICDIRMPREDGLTFTAWLERQHPELLPRLILLTGDTMSDSVAAVAARTGCQLMAKPFRQQDLDDMLAPLLQWEPVTETSTAA